MPKQVPIYMRILIVDDESINRFLLRHMLEEEGFTEIFEADGGQKALDIFPEVNPDLVLLDVVMPEVDGLEVARQVKGQTEEQYLPIIFITSLDDEDSLARCLAAGGDDFVSKPFNKVILSAKIKAHARTRSMGQDIYKQNIELLYHQNNIKREHTIVEHIFSNVLTLDEELTQYIDYQMAPASRFNGDLLLIEQSPNGGLYIVLGDFTGHGLASAIGAIPISKAFQNVAKKGLTVSEIASIFNQTLLDFLPPDMFFAAAIVEVSDNGRLLDVWNGGLPNLLLVDSYGNVKKRFKSQHMALGILEMSDFESLSERYDAELGDRFIGFTDGVIETHNDQGDMLGEEGFEEWITEQPKISVKALAEKLSSYEASEEQNDDISLLSYTCQSLDFEKKLHKKPTIPFELTLDLNAQRIRESDPVSEVVTLLSGNPAFSGVRSSLFTVLSELYNNALEHGILGLESNLKNTPEGFMDYFDMRMERLESLQEGSIQIHLKYITESHHFKLEIKDSGKGFDLSDISSSVDSDLGYGRGIALVNELTDEYTYSENGTRVHTTISF